jgi:2-polyprenyl-3-methyl-5-hydroxy-6-metoxy-1,4-benzoquinol methylase
MADDGYTFDNAAPEAGRRFSGLAAALDPVTIRHLSARGVAAGWSCLEIGTGGGSIARWLAARVGPSGSVLATDLNVAWADDGGMRNLAFRAHDIVRDPLDAEAFDLIHARLVLLHVPQREQVFDKLVASLRPGGWLLLEEFTTVLPEILEPATEAEQEVNEILPAVRKLLHARGADTVVYPRTLVRRLRAAGLRDAGAEGYISFSEPHAREVHLANLEQVGEELVAGGFVTRDQLERCLTAMRDPNLSLLLPMLVSAWGRKAGPTEPQ